MALQSPICLTVVLSIIIITMDLDLQSLSLEDTSASCASHSMGQVQWILDPAFAAQSDCVGRLLVVNDITDTILENSGLLEIFSFRRTCHLGRKAVDNYNYRTFDVDRSLRRFFDDPASFRSLQRQTDTIIAGSFVVALLDRRVYPNADLDLYTHPGFAPTVAEWLYNDGYRLVRHHLDVDEDEGDDVENGVVNAISRRELDWRNTVIDNWWGFQPPFGPKPAKTEVVDDYNALSRELYDVYKWQKEKDGQVKTVDVCSCNVCPLATILAFHSSQ